MVRAVLKRVAATAPTIIADCENGSKYFGLQRHCTADVALIEKWDDMRELCRSHSHSNYDTVIIKSIGRAGGSLGPFMRMSRQVVQRDGNPTMAGWDG